jgi:menaquinone-dependent protoporphyrinogen IX oxidase
MTVLVTYATKHGSTRGIAEAIAATLDLAPNAPARHGDGGS